MKKLIKEPLVHFLLIGAALFLIYDRVNDGEMEDAGAQIVVSPGRVEQLARVFAKTWQRPPTREELQGLIDDFVLEEAYYRQAIEMGLDRDDTIIRRRLRQKLEFLTGDAASLVEPSDEELEQYLAEHEKLFRESGTYTFQQAYFNPEKHGAEPEEAIGAMLTAFQSGETDVGDSSLLPASYEQASQQEIDGTFGIGFCRQLDDLEPGEWQGPVRSGLGYHLVCVKSRTPGKLPELAKVRAAAEREWKNSKRQAIREEMNASLRGQYEVVVEWPEVIAEDSDDDDNGKAEAGESP